MNKYLPIIGKYGFVPILLIMVFLPQVTFAQYVFDTSDFPESEPRKLVDLGPSCSSLDNFGGIASCFFAVLQVVVQIIISLGFIYTIYGSIRFIGADGTQRTEWKNVMFRGLIALVIMFSIWGIVKIFRNTLFGDTTNQNSHIPSLNSLVP